MSQARITAITKDPKIKQALFPSPGSNVSGSKGGGKPKTDYHWQLCQILFGGHKTYGAAFQKVEDCADVKKRAAVRKTWGIKIKNRLKKCVPRWNGSHIVPLLYGAQDGGHHQWS